VITAFMPSRLALPKLERLSYQLALSQVSVGPKPSRAIPDVRFKRQLGARLKADRNTEVSGRSESHSPRIPIHFHAERWVRTSGSYQRTLNSDCEFWRLQRMGYAFP
jgi:hypothetical protein